MKARLPAKPLPDPPAAGIGPSTPLYSLGPQPPAAGPPHIAPPQVPDYELLRRIGGGSYGEVWLARSVLGTRRAVKIVYRSSFDHERPFEREFEGIQKFEPISRSHDSQVDILHVGKGDGCFYYVMELADDGAVSSFEFQVSSSQTPAIGQQPETQNSKLETYIPHTLKLDLQRRGRLPPNDCVQIGLALTTALAHLHEHGLVHRDVKPSNIIFVDGRAKLADIGLVTSVDATRSFVGTEGYLPPEGAGTPQADLYSLGKVLYEMSTGQDRRHFPALPADVAQLPDAREIAELNAVVVKACQLDPRLRYQSANEMQADLARLQCGQSVRRKRTVERRLALAGRICAAVAAVTLLVAAGWLISNRFNISTIQRFNASAPAELNSLAVLPYVNESKSSAHEYLCDALADETMNALTNCVGLRVAPRPAVFAFKHATNDLRQIGQQLGVRTVLAGTFLRTSNGMHLTTRLLNVADGIQLWSENFDCGREELIPLGTGVVRQVARQLNLSLDDQVLRRLESNLARKMEAYLLYSRAAKFPRTTIDGVNQGTELLNRAIGEDSNFAQAHAELAVIYSEAGWLLPPKQCKPEARKNARRALEIDDSLPLAHTILGVVVWDYDWDSKEAEIQFRRAIELIRRNPRRSVAKTYSRFGVFLATLRRFAEADEILAEGERIDPNIQALAAARCWRYHFERRFAEVIQEATQLLSRYPDDPVGLERLAYAQQKSGHPEEALALAQRLANLEPDPGSLAELGIFQAWAGRREEARKTLADLRRTGQVRPDWAARILFALGEHEQAIEQVQQGVEEHYLGPMWMVDPFWDDLRSEPRFVALLKKMGLEK